MGLRDCVEVQVYDGHIICIIMTSSFVAAVVGARRRLHASFCTAFDEPDAHACPSMCLALRAVRSVPTTAQLRAVPEKTDRFDGDLRLAKYNVHTCTQYKVCAEHGAVQSRCRWSVSKLTSDLLRACGGENGPGRAAQQRLQALDVIPTSGYDFRLRAGKK